MKKILVGIDFTEADNTVLEIIKPLAAESGAPVTLFHSVPPMSQWVGCYLAYVPQDIENRKEADKEFRAKLDAMAEALTKEGIAADSALIESHAGPGIVKYAKDGGYDQIAIGTHSKNMVERALLGSAADYVVRKSSVPVLVVPTMK